MSSQIGEKIIEKISHINERNRYIIFGVILALVFALDYVIFMGPQLSKLTILSHQIKKLSEDIQHAKSDIAKEDQYQRQVDQLRKEVEETITMLKSKHEVPQILERISQLANKNGVKIDQILPNTAEQIVLLEAEERTYLELPIQLEARSGYHNFGRFINQIENENILMKIHTFNIASRDESRYHRIKITLNAVVYEDKN